jgi:NAD-dependent dihydropyrimidine dehydrogenase PreA subunit
MRKLTLNPELLAVDSFSTSHQASGRGTAHAHANDVAGIPVPPPDAVHGAGGDGDVGGPTADQPGYGFHTASCTHCDTCQTACP